jgi:hypothetical protein
LGVEDIPNCVIVIVHQCADEDFEPIFGGVTIKLFPKDLLGARIRESVEFFGAAHGEEVERIVAVPMFESMTFFENISAAGGSPLQKFSLRESTWISYKFRNARVRGLSAIFHSTWRLKPPRHVRVGNRRALRRRTFQELESSENTPFKTSK